MDMQQYIRASLPGVEIGNPEELNAAMRDVRKNCKHLFKHWNCSLQITVTMVGGGKPFYPEEPEQKPAKAQNRKPRSKKN